MSDPAPNSSPDTFPHARLVVGAFVGLGLAIRLVRYALAFPVWSDEAFVAANFLDRGYADLLRPLDYGQICPVPFLCGVRASVDAFGFSERSLRLFPLVCGLACVPLFAATSRRVVGGLGWVLAVAIFAVSAPPCRYASEVKPYASDLLAALLLLAPALGWLHDRSRPWRLWALAALVPFCLALSHPAVFVAGGVGLGLAPAARRAGRRTLIPFGAYLVATAASFLALYLLVMRAQDAAMPANLRGYWDGAFPPLDRPFALAAWLWRAHTGKMLAYPGGGDHGASAGTFLLVALGSVVLWHRGARSAVLIFLATPGLALTAAALHRYPYGSEARHMQFLAPWICLAAGVGGASLIEAIPRPSTRSLAARLALALLAAGGAPMIVQYVRHPYINPYDVQAREFARRFWPELSSGAEVACLHADFQVDPRGWTRLRRTFYLVNRRIVAPGSSAGPNRSSISADHPLRCVLYDGTPVDHPDVLAWLATMRSSYDLRRTREVVSDVVPPGLPPSARERLVVFEFVPGAFSGPPARREMPRAAR